MGDDLTLCDYEKRSLRSIERSEIHWYWINKASKSQPGRKRYSSQYLFEIKTNNQSIMLPYAKHDSGEAIERNEINKQSTKLVAAFLGIVNGGLYDGKLLLDLSASCQCFFLISE